MLNKITFKNYKLFQNSQELELKPITVLIGKNSSGKSAIAKLPTLIENSLSGNFDEPLEIENNGIELGAEFKDLLYGRMKVGWLNIGLEDKNERLNLLIASQRGTKDFPEIVSWKLNNNSGTVTLDNNDNYKGFNAIDEDGKFYLKSLKLNTEFIGPFRELPQRYLPKPPQSSINKVGINGKDAYSILIQDKISSNGQLVQKVSHWYEKNFEQWGIKVNEENAPPYQIELTRNTGGLSVNIRDVGEGMSQALPLITRALMPIKDEILIIVEQPELHLHPAAHGNLAQLFVETFERDKKHYLIETHSKNFVLRLRRLVAEKVLRKEDLLIYFVDFDEEKHESNLVKIEVDELGRVDFWPEDIFSETLDETMAIRTAQLNAQQNDY